LPLTFPFMAQLPTQWSMLRQFSIFHTRPEDLALALMVDKQREIATAGGRASHASGNAHEFSSDAARRAGSMSHKNDGKR
jgi:hypothetical protein